MIDKLKLMLCTLAISGLGIPVLAFPLLRSSVGDAGIEAQRLHDFPYNLTGKKIAIGQVEIGRPGMFGIDKKIDPSQQISPMRVFFRDAFAEHNKHVDPHAQNVASVMISSNKQFPGVAPDARLYSTAVGSLRRSGQAEECLASQHLAMQNSGDLRAMNFSFGESLNQDPRPNALLDGNALLTQCIDWSARVHNVFYVIAGNQGRGGISIPTDTYNGVTVAFSKLYDDRYSKIDFANIGDPNLGNPSRIIGYETNTDNRRSIGLVAPGHQVPLVNLDGTVGYSSGTSFAAPHVTATIALLQEYGDRQLAQSKADPLKSELSPPWTMAARQQEVMKAVLLNSADKLQDLGDGLNLGMSRTLYDQNHQSWLTSEAYNNAQIPLDIQMGAGHLNASRAYEQFSAGQWTPDNPVPAIGWNYDQIENAGSYQDYILDSALQQGSMLSVTLAWNRLVELNDRNQNQAYDIGETFDDRGLNNLDIFLMPAESTDISDSIWSSISDVDSVEHIFYRIPRAGKYKIRVYYRQQVNEAQQPYAIAWWTVPVKN
ncbi:S8 family serine peptidase [Roseofilum sp. BLCC_M154]|uniref:S8 family serine peptidase n=1 Tax=Roseofilum acuticapitatum BLCC-M154 TaxID=3022444 RepID=A0ABT7ATG2_9CYAN|nr:S8 family serine peptidase [Roseofilum acuticapitatum]MDJ1169867.1 S8 family serine peptidase [Roseofilum acuticapitatum BLCC-M154]